MFYLHPGHKDLSLLPPSLPPCCSSVCSRPLSIQSVFSYLIAPSQLPFSLYSQSGSHYHHFSHPPGPFALTCFCCPATPNDSTQARIIPTSLLPCSDMTVTALEKIHNLSVRCQPDPACHSSPDTSALS